MMKRMQIRVYRTQVDDSGRMLWLAESGWPTSPRGRQWINFVSTLACSTRAEALKDLSAAINRRLRDAKEAQKQFRVFMKRSKKGSAR